MALLVLVAPALQAAATEDMADVEDIEWVGDLEIMDAGPGGESHSIGMYFGRLHVLSIHFPIAWTWLALVLALARCRWPERIGGWDLVILLAAAISFVPALSTGWVHRLNLHSRSDLSVLMDRHKIAAFCAFGALLIAVLLRVLAHRTGSQRAHRFALTAIGAAVALVSFTAHLGGSMVFGPDFLRFW